MYVFGFVFGCIFGSLWLHFWCDFGCDYEAFFDTFLDFVRNSAPHGSVGNSDWIEGRPLRKSTKQLSETEEKTAGKRKGTHNGFWDDFGLMLGGFGDHFGSQNTFKHRENFWIRFWRPKKGLARFFWVGPAECAGPVGRIMEGYENIQKRRGDEDKAKEI